MFNSKLSTAMTAERKQAEEILDMYWDDPINVKYECALRAMESYASLRLAELQAKMPSVEVDELEEYVRLLKIDADKMPKDKFDLLQRGRQEAYSHCWFTFHRMVEKFRSRMSNPNTEGGEG